MPVPTGDVLKNAALRVRRALLHALRACKFNAEHKMFACMVKWQGGREAQGCYAKQPLEEPCPSSQHMQVQSR